VTTDSVASPLLLSVLLVTPHDYQAIRTTIRALNSQTIASGMQLVIAAPSAEAVRIPPDAVSRLARCDVVEVGAIDNVSRAKVDLLTHALAPVIAFAEDHSFPEPTWAAALLQAHARGYSGVAPRMLNANPRTLLSWSSLFVHFGGAVENEAGEVRYGSASHNTSYSRSALEELGDELPYLLQSELFLQDALHARGHRLFHEPAAATRHVQATRISGWLGQGFAGGRLYGAMRVRVGGWPVHRRVFMTAAAPLIPVLRLTRTFRQIRRTPHAKRLLPWVLPHIAAALLVHAAGEVWGYAFGMGGTDLRYSRYEMSRFRDTVEADRSAWA
jgi:hypothetical protein